MPPFDHDAFNDVADMIYNAGGFDLDQIKDPKARKLIRETVNTINRGVDAHLPTDVPDTLRCALEENGFIFSGFKTFHAMRELGLSMLTADGNIKSYDEFKKDVQQIDAHYNTNYLYAEWKHAIGACQMAAKWHEQAKDGDRYDLQYRTAQDPNVREDHRLLHGTTLPLSDPFWDKYYPPNGWGCRCTVVQVRKGKFPLSDPKLAMLRGDNATDTSKLKIFRYNPGKTMTLFPPKHPYYKAPATAKAVVKQVAAEESEKDRLKRYIEELPKNLTEAEKAAIAQNCIDIENGIKKRKGKPMTHEDADKQSANPKHVLKYLPDPNGAYVDKQGNHYRLNPDYKSSDRQYSINCQTCAPAYALRLRGFDFTAKGNVSGSQSEYLSHCRSFEAWLNTDGTPCTGVLTYDWMISKGYAKMTPKRYREYFEETCKEEGVYILTIGWKGKNAGGHATILQRFPDGKLKYVEPQEYDANKGTARTLDELCDDGAAQPYWKRGILRVDNKLFNTKFLSIFD